MRKTARSPLLRALTLYQPYIWPILFSCAGLGVSVAAGMVFPLLTRHMIDVAIPTGDAALLIKVGILAAVSPVAAWAFHATASFRLTMIGLRVVRNLRLRLIERCLGWPMSRWDEMRTGGIQTRVMMDAGVVHQLVAEALPALFRAVFLLPATVVVLVALDRQLATLCLLLLPLYAVPAAALSGPMRAAWRSVAERSEDTMRSIHDTIAGVRLLKAMALEDSQARKMEAPLDAQVRSHRRATGLSLGYHGLTSLVASAIPAGLVVVGGLRVISRLASLGTVIAFINYVQQLVGSINVLPSTYVQSRQYVAHLTRVYEYLENDIEDFSGLAAPTFEKDRSLVFHNVSFGYGRGDPVLEDISFDVRSGETVALIGSSGSGKSTIVSLALGLYRHSGGRITVFGNDLETVDVRSLRGRVGIVQQDTFLFDTTIRDNIACARPDASEADIVASAQIARIHDFVASLPDGYDTLAGERGIQLSAGQRQRIAIARTLLRNPPLLILDEATSALDPATEADIQADLLQLMEGRTCLIITHRLSTIQHASRILVLDGGRIVERGTHTELLAQSGLYRELLSRQGSGLPTSEA